MSETLTYIYYIIIIVIGCFGSGYIGYLDNKFINSSLKDKKTFYKKYRYKYTLGYFCVFTSLFLIILYSIKLCIL